MKREGRAVRLGSTGLLALTLCTAQAAAQRPVGAFVHVPGTDAMTDRDVSHITTLALRSANEADPARLSWRCSGSTIEVVLRAPEFEGLSGPVPIRWRFDRDPASDREWWRASTLEPEVLAPQEWIYPFSEMASIASEVLVRAQDGDGRLHDYRFSLSGFMNGLNRLGCARNLEVLGQRRVSALFEQAARVGGSVPDEGGLATLIGEFPFVGHRTQRRFTSSRERCWQVLWRVEELEFFRSEEEAGTSGYARGEGCSP